MDAALRKSRSAVGKVSSNKGNMGSSQASTAKTKVVRKQEPTTIMIRKLPRGCTRAMLQSKLDSEGFAGQYDFLYLPYSFHDWSIVGHAFVNFSHLHHAEQAVQSLNEKVLWPNLCWIDETEACEACWSKALRGLDSCIGRFRNSPVMHPSVADEYKPIVLRHGRRWAFPEPTKEIQPARCHAPKSPPQPSEGCLASDVADSPDRAVT